MTTFGKLTRFNFSKQKYNTTSIFLFFFLPSTVQLFPNILRPNRIPCPEQGIKMRRWSHTKVNAENQHSSRRPQVFHLNTLLILFLSQFVKVFYRKFFKIIWSQIPGFFNDTQLHEICVSIWLIGIKSNFCLFW